MQISSTIVKEEKWVESIKNFYLNFLIVVEDKVEK